MADIDELGSDNAAYDISYPTTADGIYPPDLDAPADFLTSEQLATLITVVRRPPELPFTELPLVSEGEIDPLLDASLDGLAGLEPTELAFAVAELLVRREPEFGDLAAEGGQAGLEVLAELARMYEHLFLSQTGNGGL